MYIQFVLDPFVPHGTNKVIRRVIRDLSNVFGDFMYSVETDETLPRLSRDGVTTSIKIFQKRVPIFCRGVTVYILSTKILWQGNEVFGVSRPDRCVIGISSFDRHSYEKWAAKVWELILHEWGHSVGLIEKNRRESRVGANGTRHCLNDCVMSETIFENIWTKLAVQRYKQARPYCRRCLRYLLSKNV